MKILKGLRTRTTLGVFRCPHCGAETETLVGGHEEPFECEKCRQILAKNDEELKKTVIEREVNAYICPECYEKISDTPMNWCHETTDGQNAVMCPKCHAFLNGLPLIHHGEATGKVAPFYSGTDYFGFRHNPCGGKKWGGFCTIYAVLIDKQGRVIFNLQCMDCGAIDALKTHTFLWAKDKALGGKTHTIEAIYLSPSLRRRIAKHSWDNL